VPFTSSQELRRHPKVISHEIRQRQAKKGGNGQGAAKGWEYG